MLDFRLLAKWMKGAYLSVGDIWLALILDEKVRESPIPEYTHIGLTVSIEDFPILSQRIQQSGVKIWQKNKSEGASLYFLDPNDHKLEIYASDLNTRIKSARTSPWEGLEFFI